jgi:DNA-binding PadR family transcriptional regulator
MARVFSEWRSMGQGGDRTLGSFEQLVLLAIVRVGEEAYGVSVQEEIERTTGRSVTPGALYRALDRLEARGLVLSGTGEPTGDRGGRRRRTLRITREGARDLAEALKAVRGLAEGLDARIRALAR